MRRAVPVLLLLPVLAGCGQSAPTDDVAGPAGAAEESTAGQSTAEQSAPDPLALLRSVPAAAEAAGSVRYTSVTESATDGGAARIEGRLAGALDLAADAGTGRLELPALDDLAADAGAADEASVSADLQAMADITLSWTATDVTAVVAGERHTASRDSDDTGIVGRVPAEPAGLLDVVGAGTDVTLVGQERLDGVRTTRLTATLEPQAAVDAGLGTQAQLSIARTAAIPVEVWIDTEGRPARIRFEAQVPSQQGSARSMTTTYDYRGWGEPVDVTP